MFQDQKHVIKITFAKIKVSLALWGDIRWRCKKPRAIGTAQTMCSVQKLSFLIPDSPQVWNAYWERGRNEMKLCNKGK